MKHSQLLCPTLFLLICILVLGACNTVESDSMGAGTVATTIGTTVPANTTTVSTEPPPAVTDAPSTTAASEPDDPIIIKPCEHDYVLTQGTPSCTTTVTLQYTCSKCKRTYTEKIQPTGHIFEKGHCTACNFVDITTLTGDEIMDLIKESGCPEDSLVYGFDSEVGDDELAKIQDFLVNTDARYAFSDINNITFYSPYDVDPLTILYHFTPTKRPTKAEYEEYYKYHNITTDEEKEWVNLEYKMTTKEISNYLKTYFGIEFTKQMKEDLKKEATYLKKYDAYYLGATDFAGYPPFSVVKAYKSADGTILAIPSEYSPEQINERTSLYWAVILTPYKGSYRIAMSVNLYSLH